jgi:DNA-binding SARP family transcriptional activator
MTLHRQVAEAAEGHDWRLACHHYAQIGDEAGIIRTIDSAVEEIVARGDVLVADEFLASLRSAETATSHEVIRSRSEVRRGEYGKALERAEAAAATDPASPVALANLASAAYRVGRIDLANEAANRLASFAEESSFSEIGRGILAMLQSSLDGHLQAAVAELLRMRQLQQTREHFHHEGTTLLNMALLHKAQGDARSALTAADEALLLLAQDSTGAELPSAWAVRAWASAHLGRLEEARECIRRAIETGDSLARAEVMLEAAEIETWYGDSEKALDLLREARPFIQRHPGIETLYVSISTQFALRVGDVSAARTHAESFPSGLSIIVANKTEQMSLRAYVAMVSRAESASQAVEAALDHASSTGARFWLELDRLLMAVLHGSEALNREIRRLARDEAVYLSVWAELLVDRANLLGEAETGILKKEMAGRAERWVGPLRAAIDRGGANAVAASEFLEHIGTADDVQRLRRLSRQSKAGYRKDLGKNLARRVADRVYIEDQGRVAIRIGSRYLEGAVIRRKVLALLCFLLTRSRFSAARDEVLEALWPDFEPSIALNSLNQTVYFLRRVFEPAYREDLSPGYVRHESDVVWLDRQLVSSRSQLCADFLKSLPSQPSPSDVDRLAAMYQGPFALDFAYEDWAVGFRDSLHAAYLQVMENAVASDLASGHFARGIAVARRALVVDPDTEQIELSLLRLLRLSGAHAAAAEQYAHYSAVLRNSLGIEPPPLDAL